MGGRGGKSKSGSGGGAVAAGGGATATAIAEPPAPAAPEFPKGEIPKSSDEFAAITGIDPDEAKDLYRDVKMFTGSYYDEIRKTERTGSGDNFYKQKVENINKFLDLAPQHSGKPIYRGMSFDSKEQFDSFMKQVGDNSLELNAMSSFSRKKSVAEKFSSGGAYRVVLEVATPTKGVHIKKISSFNYEDEVLVKKGTRYRIANTIDRSSGGINKYVIQLEEIN